MSNQLRTQQNRAFDIFRRRLEALREKAAEVGGMLAVEVSSELNLLADGAEAHAKDWADEAPGHAAAARANSDANVHTHLDPERSTVNAGDVEQFRQIATATGKWVGAPMLRAMAFGARAAANRLSSGTESGSSDSTQPPASSEE